MLVQEAIAHCNTGIIDGLSQQLLDRLLAKKYLVKLDHPLIICEGRHNNPYLQPRAAQDLIKAIELYNRPFIINSCLRTVMQQYLLRQQYEKKLCGITAAATPGRSNHQSGLAIDIPDYLFWRSPLSKHGWKWLGSWDRWHFDYQHGGVNLGVLQISEFQQLWNEYNRSEPLKVDGIWGSKTASCVARSPVEGFDRYPSLKRGDINSEVGQLQLLLRQVLQLSPSELVADCQYGPQTERAVASFQKQHGLTVDGVAGQKTIEKLLRVTGRESL